MKKDIRIEEGLHYLVEKASKVARRYAQQRFSSEGFDVTVDQWLVMRKIADSNGITQAEVAEAVFKDTASITRILSLLLAKKLVSKQTGSDKRAYQLSLTAAGKRLVDKMQPVVKNIRGVGITGMSDREVKAIRQGLEKIIANFG